MPAALSPSLSTNPALAFSDAELLRQLDLHLFTVDPLRYARQIFPHHFTLPVPARWHAEALQLMCRVGESRNQGAGTPLGAPSLPLSPQFSADQKLISVSDTLSQPALPPLRLAFHAPRGHAKSTLASFLLPMWSILAQRKHFILLVSNTHAQAVKFLQGIKYEWETNRALRALLKDMEPHKDKWSDSEIELKRNGKLDVKLLALGSGHQLRGLRFLQWRPDLCIIDDGEDDEMVRSDLRRATYQEWFDHVVLNIDPQCDVIHLGTIIHEQSLLNRLVRQRDDADQHRYAPFIRRIFPAMDASGVSTWPERESTENLLEQRERNPYSFSQEKQGEPVDPSYCPFKTEFFTEHRFWPALPKQLSISITIDPAWTIRDYSKETALICAGWDSHVPPRLWVLDEHHAKYDDPSLILDLILDWYLRWNKNEAANLGQRFFCVGFDAISAQKMLLTAFRDRCAQRNLHPCLRELKADRDKIRRIWQLELLFRQDRIFLRPDMVYLQHQLQGFPRNVQGGLVDCADALAYHLQLESYRPTEPEESPEAPRHPFQISFEEYANLHEDVRAYRQRFPDADMPETLITLLAKGTRN